MPRPNTASTTKGKAKATSTSSKEDKAKAASTRRSKAKAAATLKSKARAKTPEFTSPPLSVKNLWTISSKMTAEDMEQLWDKSYSCSKADSDSANNVVIIKVASSSSVGNFDGAIRELGRIPAHYYSGARLTLHHAVYYTSYILAGWSDKRSPKEATIFSGLLRLANYYRLVFLDLVLKATEQFPRGRCPEDWRWPRFDDHLEREHSIRFHDPTQGLVKKFKYKNADSTQYGMSVSQSCQKLSLNKVQDWAKWADRNEIKFLFHSQDFDCFRKLSLEGLVHGGKDLEENGFRVECSASMNLFVSLRPGSLCSPPTKRRWPIFRIYANEQVGRKGTSRARVT